MRFYFSWSFVNNSILKKNYDNNKYFFWIKNEKNVCYNFFIVLDISIVEIKLFILVFIYILYIYELFENKR